MDDTAIARVAQNEARYRAFNEEIRWFVGEAPTRTFEILCECGSADCRMLITVTAQEYGAVRANATRFFVKQGHQVDEVERVIEQVDSELPLGSYLVVEKDKGVGRDIAEATDPRAS